MPDQEASSAEQPVRYPVSTDLAVHLNLILPSDLHIEDRIDQTHFEGRIRYVKPKIIER